jgi:class 3 adenylate cyclase
MPSTSDRRRGGPAVEADVQQAEPSPSPPGAAFSAAERYLLLADISGYTGFMAGVEQAHGVDFSAGIPAAYSVLNDLLDTVSAGVAPDFSVIKLEGDAVFAAAPASSLDGHGGRILNELATMYRSFIEARTRAIPASDHQCTACPAVAHLDLKVVLHRGHTVQQVVGSGTDLLGPAVTVAHRLLKNTIRDRIGFRPYLFLSDAAATGLGVPDVGLQHVEDYADAGRIGGRIVDLDQPAGG